MHFNIPRKSENVELKRKEMNGGLKHLDSTVVFRTINVRLNKQQKSVLTDQKLPAIKLI